MKPWHFRWARGLIYTGALIAAVAVALAAKWDQPDLGQVLVAARQLFGLWALGFLLASMLLGPLTAIFPWLPLRPSLMYARRAVGVSALFFAHLHVAAYAGSLVRRDWHELYTPGLLWVVGLSLGALAAIDLITLAVTSRDASVKAMGGRKWKRLHRSVYVALPVILLHALFVGADFGLNHAPDVKAAPDAGALIGFLCLSAAWLTLILLRRRHWHWTPKPLRRPNLPPDTATRA
jgi:sulfoxide reductase heme-binding subunit YedZ